MQPANWFVPQQAGGWEVALSTWAADRRERLFWVVTQRQLEAEV